MNSIFILISPMLVFILMVVPLAVLREIEMRARLFLGFGGFFLYIGMAFMYLLKEKNRKILIFLISFLLGTCLFFHFIYIYGYGNVLKSQKEYEKKLAYNISYDLENLNSDKQFQTISFVGEAPRARQVQMVCNKHSFLNEIVPVYFGNSTWLGGAWLYCYMQNDLIIEEANNNDLQVIKKARPIFKNSIYCGYVNEEKIIVYFQ